MACHGLSADQQCYQAFQNKLKLFCFGKTLPSFTPMWVFVDLQDRQAECIVTVQ